MLILWFSGIWQHVVCHRVHNQLSDFTVSHLRRQKFCCINSNKMNIIIFHSRCYQSLWKLFLYKVSQSLHFSFIINSIVNIIIQCKRERQLMTTLHTGRHMTLTHTFYISSDENQEIGCYSCTVFHKSDLFWLWFLNNLWCSSFQFWCRSFRFFIIIYIFSHLPNLQ